MKKSHLFPKISAQIFNSPSTIDEFYLFNTSSNKGFAIDGFAADLCKKFIGEATLAETVRSLEIESKLKEGEYEEEIDNLILELERNSLIEFFEEAQAPSKK
ncbi:MAG: hypothetical protein H7336_07540 [Bacteriovorax sp.]|nr:hypothetical protein [Bacteriovorax sp.]